VLVLKDAAELTPYYSFYRGEVRLYLRPLMGTVSIPRLVDERIWTIGRIITDRGN
jgi:hypothetical protein